ncbi:50S ribosomal protein L4 [Candidatus Pacearchaeota archaeon]|jgi:large subunit ribosomal protein L4e|nr:50S ribosomal protein L4 [Candidatus Pacearchaeota archaeon]|tara:strand:+ start:6461 stop:7369 length:909 start_codon:yes stop_codon:yes gene_type:complete
MKLQVLNKEGKKVKEMDTKLFEEPIRIDIISKIVEAEKIKQPFSNTFRAGMDRSASGNVRHRRHVWKSHYGRGMSRIPRKAMSRRGTQFSWVGAIVPFARGGRRAHPPKGSTGLVKINRKEAIKALLSSLSYVADNKAIEKKYARIEKVEGTFPLIVEDKVVELKTGDFLKSLKKILGDLYEVAIQEKSVRAGKGKMRGRKYKQNAGLLFIVGNDEDKNVNGIDIIKVNDLSVSDLASGGARLTLFSEKAIEELEKVFDDEKKSKTKEIKVKKVDIRKIRRENRKKKVKKIEDKSEGVKEDA